MHNRHTNTQKTARPERHKRRINTFFPCTRRVVPAVSEMTYTGSDNHALQVPLSEYLMCAERRFVVGQSAGSGGGFKPRCRVSALKSCIDTVRHPFVNVFRRSETECRQYEGAQITQIYIYVHVSDVSHSTHLIISTTSGVCAAPNHANHVCGGLFGWRTDSAGTHTARTFDAGCVKLGARPVASRGHVSQKFV